MSLGGCCRAASLPMHARALAFRLADRLGMQPADLGLLN
jgi:hypothetical protein